jgi:FkbM family methyltransferase
VRGAIGVIRRVYRYAAAGCAEIVSRVPALEQPFVRFGAHAWGRPIIGRFYRSAADRLAQRFRRAGSSFRTLTVSGVPLILDVTEFTTHTLYFGQVPYEPRTTECLVQHLKSGSVFVDVGANHGYFTSLAAALVGATGRVVAFEPNPLVFEQLRTHVRLNAFESRVTAIQAALADVPDDDGRLFVSQVQSNSGLSSLAPALSQLDSGSLSPAHVVPVRIDTFDRWFQSSGIDRVDLVKIDVEGAQDRVAAGMVRTLSSGRIGAIVCETVWDGPAHRAFCHAGFVPRVLESMDSVENVLYSRPGGSAS